VLLDIPRLRGVPWLEPGDHVTAAELAAAEQAQQVRVGPGDLLFVRVGHRRRRDELGPWEVARSRAGLHPDTAGFLADRQVAALGCDSNSDTAPSVVDGVAFPVHVLTINALGLCLLDYLQFDDLVPVCEAVGRWSFLCVIAPLRLPGGTGSPVNPISIRALSAGPTAQHVTVPGATWVRPASWISSTGSPAARARRATSSN
jgi:kynurenine formamidase